MWPLSLLNGNDVAKAALVIKEILIAGRPHNEAQTAKETFDV